MQGPRDGPCLVASASTNSVITFKCSLLTSAPTRVNVKPRQLGILGLATGICGFLIVVWTELPRLGSDGCQSNSPLPSPIPVSRAFSHSREWLSVNDSAKTLPTACEDSASWQSGEDFGKRLSQALKTEEKSERDAALSALCQRWGMANPQQALRTALEIAEPGVREQVTRELCQAWATRDPEQAARWALQIPDSFEQSRALDFVFSKIAETQPSKALELIRNNLGQAQPGLIGNLVQQRAAADIRAAYDWANALPPGEVRQESLRRVAVTWAKTDPGASAKFVAEQLAPGPEQTEAAVSVIHQWALRDLGSASAWANQFPEGPLRDRMFAEIAGVEAMTAR